MAIHITKIYIQNLILAWTIPLFVAKALPAIQTANSSLPSWVCFVLFAGPDHVSWNCLLLSEIEKRYKSLKRHDAIRIEQWCKKLCEIGGSYKKLRNQYALVLLEQTLNQRLEAPFISIPPEGHLPATAVVPLNKTFHELMQKLQHKTLNHTTIQELEQSEIVKKSDNDATTFCDVPAAAVESEPVPKIVEQVQQKHNESLKAFIDLKGKMAELHSKQDEFRTAAEIIRLKSENEVLKSTVQSLKAQLEVFTLCVLAAVTTSPHL